MTMRHLAGLAGSLAAALLVGTSALADPIVINGEEIADAELAAAAAAEGNRFTMYHGWPEQMFAGIQAAFESDTGITVDTIRLTSQSMHPRVTSEYAAGRLDADYVDLTDLVLLKDMVDQGIVDHPHRVPWFDDLDEAHRDPEGRWYAGGLFTQVLAINSAIVDPADAPARWMDALEPEWHGRIGMPSIDAGGSAFALHSFLRREVSEDYWERLAAQQPRIYPAVAPASTDLVRGEFELGLMGASTVVAQIGAGAPLTIIFPEEGLAAFPISGGITSTAQRPNSAAIWVNWMTSRRGGEVMAAAGVYGIHPEAPSPVLENGLEFPPVSQVWTIDPETWAEIRESYSQEWRAAFDYN